MTKTEIELTPEFDDHCDRVIALRELGGTYVEIATQFGLGSATLARKLFLQALQGREPAERHVLQRRELERYNALASHIAARKDLTSEGIRRRLATVDQLRSELIAD